MTAKERLQKIVDVNNVIDDPSVLEKYASDLSFVHAMSPEYVVRPVDSSQVQVLVKMANEELTPIVPISSGFPHFRGDTVPSIGGATIVDLSGMKNILRIDKKNRVAMVEPGVTFSELKLALEEEGLRLNMPLLPRRSKSVIGSMLEREPVMMPKYHWDIADPLLCTEIVFGSGDILRTGSAAGPGTLEEQWNLGSGQEIPMGPGQCDWYRIIQGAQGTIGIVTWATVRCERQPDLEEAFLIGSQNLDDISEIMHWLIRLRLVNECLVLNSCNLAAILASKLSEDYRILQNKLPAWILFCCIAGYEYFPEERVSYQTKEMVSRARIVGIKPTKQVGPISASELLKVLQLPSEEPYWKLRSKGSCYDIFFLTTREKLPEFINTMFELAARHNHQLTDIGVYVQPIVQGTSCHCEFSLFFDDNSEEEIRRIKKLSAESIQALMSDGAFFSRPYGQWADMVYRRDAETTIALRKLKRIFDPNDIMNPGKLCF